MEMLWIYARSGQRPSLPISRFLKPNVVLSVEEFAQRQGFKQANISTPYFGVYLTKLVSDWIRDPGQIKKLGYRVIRMSFVDDILKFKGKVSKKYQEAGQNFVDYDLWVENQEGVQVATATATVSLLG